MDSAGSAVVFTAGTAGSMDSAVPAVVFTAGTAGFCHAAGHEMAPRSPTDFKR